MVLTPTSSHHQNDMIWIWVTLLSYICLFAMVSILFPFFMPTLINIVTPFLTVEALNLSFFKTFFVITVSKSWGAFLWKLRPFFTLSFLLIWMSIGFVIFSLSFLPVLLFTIAFLECLGLQGLLSRFHSTSLNQSQLFNLHDLNLFWLLNCNYNVVKDGN